MQTKQFSQIVSCTTKISKDFVSTKFQQLYFANYVETTRSHASLRSRAPVGLLPHPPSLCLDFNFPYAHTRFYSLFLNRSIICSLFLFSSFLNRKLFIFLFPLSFFLDRSISLFSLLLSLLNRIWRSNPFSQTSVSFL